MLAENSVRSTIRKPHEHRDRQRPAPLPAAHRQREHQHGGHQHGAGDGDAVGRGEVGRRLEAQHQRHHADQQQPVDRRHVDLAELAGRGVAGCARAGSGRAARPAAPSRRRRRWWPARRSRWRPWRAPPADRAPRRAPGGRTDSRARVRIGQQQRALAVVVGEQRGQHQPQPGAPDRLAAEMAHVGIERLGAGHRQRHGAQREEGDEAVVQAEADGVVRQRAPPGPAAPRRSGAGPARTARRTRRA